MLYTGIALLPWTWGTERPMRVCALKPLVTSGTAVSRFYCMFDCKWSPQGENRRYTIYIKYMITCQNVSSDSVWFQIHWDRSGVHTLQVIDKRTLTWRRVSTSWDQRSGQMLTHSSMWYHTKEYDGFRLIFSCTKSFSLKSLWKLGVRLGRTLVRTLRNM